ncbi:MAG: hypothetical protein D6776_09495 [Planctomycetota bacterium]|nr:MAG: hypothetical protein D6776_09495 [Planctomycetota bacterium]
MDTARQPPAVGTVLRPRARAAGRLERARAIVRAAAESLERRCYRFEQVCAHFCNRDAHTLQRAGHIHYGTPCHDLATLALFELARAGHEPVAVLCRVARWLQPVKYQCGIELWIAGAAYHVGFGVTSTRFAPGRFVPAGHRSHVLRAPYPRSLWGAPLLRCFGLCSPEQVDRAIAGHHHRRHLRSYRGSTRPWRWRRAERRALARFARGDDPWLLTPGRWRAARADGSPLVAVFG